MSKTLKKELRACKTQLVTDCGLTFSAVAALEGNPAGVSRGDESNPDYRGKISVQNGRLSIKLSYVLTGDIYRAEAGLKNIVKLYSAAGVAITMMPSPLKYDLRIHGATLGELAQGLKLCDCNAALYIGGWAPSYRHYRWGKALLLNPFQPRNSWALTDVHEFGHKLGLKHRIDKGIMDYPPKKGPDMRKITSSDIQRIVNLYP